MIKKQPSDYILLLGGILLNYSIPAMILTGSKFESASPYVIWPLIIFLGSILTILMVKKWQKTFVIYSIEFNKDVDINFKICHKVIKEYKNEILENDYREKHIVVKL